MTAPPKANELVPRIVAGVDVRQFKLAPTDGFLLTRIDGKRGARALALETGLPDFSVASTLEKLQKLGVIELIDPSAPPPPAPPPAPPAPPAAPRSALGRFDDGLLAPKYAPEELEEPADLTPEQKKRVLDVYYRLDDLDHYTLLGVTSQVDKKATKRAYFELAAAFHPDRFFKKNLGSFKAKMEAVFNRATEAHDTLVDPQKRAEYDAYLAEVATTRGMESMLERALAEAAQASPAQAPPAQVASSAPPSGGRVVVPSGAPPSGPAASGPVPSRPAPSGPVASGPPGPSAAPPSGPAAPSSAAPSGPSEAEIRARKEALARRLMGGQRSPASAAAARRPSGTSEKPNPLRYSSPADAMDALKRRYEDRLENATQQHAQRYVQAAEDALAKNDLGAASAALNLAVKFAPDDVALAMRAAEVKNLADASLAKTFQEQAVMEERQGDWAEAARSWMKVAKIKDDAVSHERAANASLRGGEGDLRLAAEHAKRAITLAPDVIENHLTLAEVYLKAGLTTSARRAAEAASQIDPKNAALGALLKRLQ